MGERWVSWYAWLCGFGLGCAIIGAVLISVLMALEFYWVVVIAIGATLVVAAAILFMQYKIHKAGD